MMFIGYTQENPENCFRMVNPESGRVTLTQDLRHYIVGTDVISQAECKNDTTIAN
jgi:hypothetical protein